MPKGRLKQAFAPQRIAVIGASERVGTAGWKVLHNLAESAFDGGIVAVNPNYPSIQGFQCFPDIASVGGPPDLAIVCVPASDVPAVIGQCDAAGITTAIVLSVGFREAGRRGQATSIELREVIKQCQHVRVLGPNSMGLLSPHRKLNASLIPRMPNAGHIAFLSQSGAICASVLDWAATQSVGFSHVISFGNEADIGLSELIDYLADDPLTDAVVLYVESIQKAREFMSAARAFTRNKPIVALKAGRSQASAIAAASHTGAMVGRDDVYDAALSRAGIVRVDKLEDLLDCAEVLADAASPRGPNLAIVTNSGALGIMSTDAMRGGPGKLVELSTELQRKLADIIRIDDSATNPIDIQGDATPQRYADATAVLLADHGIDAVAALLSPQAMTDTTGCAAAIAEVAAKHRKPILAAWVGGYDTGEAIELLETAGVPCFATPEKAVGAFHYLLQYSRRREMLYETPRALPIDLAVDRDRVQRLLRDAPRSLSGVLSEKNSKALLAHYGIPTTGPLIAESAGTAIAHAHSIGFPVAMKIDSLDIAHKSDVGGVELNLINADAVANAYHRIATRCREELPGLRGRPVTVGVQPMRVDPQGRELIIGAKRDPVFGSVLMVGAGGIDAELFHDRALELPPLNESLARRMLQSLRCWPTLGRYRGKEPVDLDRLIEVLVRLSYLVADCPQIKELDVNPLLVGPRDVVALDACVAVDTKSAIAPKPYSHLAIRPYPDNLIRQTNAKDGTPVTLRPIKPEDEPLWRRLISDCSTETIRLRFRYLFQGADHEMASRFCFNDYDRELAMVAEIADRGETKLAGIGRLVAEPDRPAVEFAVLVADPWQGRGLGAMLMDECLQICRAWDMDVVFAEVAPENTRMLKMFEDRGFEIQRRIGADVVKVRLPLG